MEEKKLEQEKRRAMGTCAICEILNVKPIRWLNYDSTNFASMIFQM